MIAWPLAAGGFSVDFRQSRLGDVDGRHDGLLLAQHGPRSDEASPTEADFGNRRAGWPAEATSNSSFRVEVIEARSAAELGRSGPWRRTVAKFLR